MELITLGGFEKATQAIGLELEKFRLIEITSETETEARKKRAELNKFRTSIDDSRKFFNKEVKKVFEELIAPVDERLGQIDLELDTVEKEREEKTLLEIFKHYETLDLDIDYSLIHDKKWLNKTCDWQKELEYKVNEIKRDLKLIPKLTKQVDLLKQEYINNGFNLSAAAYMIEEKEVKNADTSEDNNTFIMLKNTDEETNNRVFAYLNALKIEFQLMEKL